MSEAAVIEVRDLGKSFQQGNDWVHVLDGVALSIAAGERVAIVGASGSGKTTLLGLLAGLDEPRQGQVHLLGQDLSTLDEDARARLRAGQVGFVFQNFQLLPGLSALENVMLPLQVMGRADALSEARASLKRVGLEARAGNLPAQLSGGEQQRVALARAFAPRPRVLFADEPTGNLDHATAGRIIELLFALRQETGVALVLVTHDRDLADLCERRVHLVAGCLQASA